MQLKLKMYCLQQLTHYIDQTFTLSIRMSESGENLASTWYLYYICKSCRHASSLSGGVSCCKGCVLILVNCAKDLVVSQFVSCHRFHSRICKWCSFNLPLLRIYAECLKMQLVMDADLVCRVRGPGSWSMVGTFAACPPLLYTGWCPGWEWAVAECVLEQPHHPGQGPDTAWRGPLSDPWASLF